MADQPVTREKLINADIDVENLGKAVNEKGVVNPRYGDPYKSLPLAIQEVIETGGFEPFATEVELLASTPLLTKKAAKALDTKKIWLWENSAWTDTGLSDLDQANTYTDLKIKPLNEIELSKTNDSPTVIPVLVDESNKTLIGYDTEKDQIEAGGLQEQVLENFPNLMLSNDTSRIAVLTDKNNKILIGYDTETDKPIIAGLELQMNIKPLVAEINHLVGYGQSLKTGATATVILSTSQPYANVTFNTGPRKDSAATSLVPLVEQFNNPSSDGYANRGETCCSGAANYASRAMMLEDGIDPSEHVIFASTAAHGGYRVDQLKKGTAWYNFFLEHIAEAKRLAGSKTYKTQAVDWGQGENEAVAGGIQIPYDVYKPELAQLQIDATNDIKAITGQQESVPFITYQMSYSAATWPDIAKAQLDLVRENPNFMLSTPMYHMPYASDAVHLTNVGYKWFGAYVGRAYKQYVVEGRKSDFINPKSAQIIGDEIHIKFEVPKLPLVIDVTTLAATTNHGFKVVSNGVAAAITSITTIEDTVIIKLSAIPTGTVKVRYALDYLGFGIILTGGASGNLRDSTTDTVVIAGIEKPLYHVCPHFELTAFLDKGI